MTWTKEKRLKLAIEIVGKVKDKLTLRKHFYIVQNHKMVNGKSRNMFYIKYGEESWDHDSIAVYEKGSAYRPAWMEEVCLIANEIIIGKRSFDGTPTLNTTEELRTDESNGA